MLLALKGTCLDGGQKAQSSGGHLPFCMWKGMKTILFLVQRYFPYD